jgi:hypothetical protein|tara:strand:- start:1290 stop:1430 length:141 start_codon:yes stop_codon:yes gene_type:complete
MGLKEGAFFFDKKREDTAAFIEHPPPQYKSSLCFSTLKSLGVLVVR